MRLIGAIGIALIATLAALVSRPAFAAESLTLDQFMSQVDAGNVEVQSHKEGQRAGELRGREYKLAFLPTLVGQVEDSRDARITNAPAFMGRENRVKSYSLGVQQNLGVGVDATVSYRVLDTEILGADPLFIRQPHFVLASPVLELNASLFKNFWGSETAARKEVSVAGAEALRLMEAYQLVATRAMAESTYWRLVSARKLVASAQENLKRADRIQQWSSRRSRLSLSDRSDLLQSNAIVAARKIELASAIDEERAAARDFNKMRGSENALVTELLQALEPEQISLLTLPQRQGLRGDILAAEKNANLQKANSKLAEEAMKPDVKVYAMLSFNGRDSDMQNSVNQSFNNTYPYNMVGVKLAVPLAQNIASDVRASHRAQARSAELMYQRRAFESEKDWQNLSERFEEAKKRLTLAHEMEKAQLSKVEYEKDRFGKGRTTTYQVITFEQDFASAQVMRINLEREILDIYAQLKTFGGVP